VQRCQWLACTDFQNWQKTDLITGKGRAAVLVAGELGLSRTAKKRI